MFGVEVNFVAVLVAGVVSYFLGALFYSPWLFGNKWLKLNGMKESDAKSAATGH